MKTHTKFLLVGLLLGACSAPPTADGSELSARIDTNGDGRLDTTVSLGRGAKTACEGECDSVTVCDLEFCPDPCTGDDCDMMVDESDTDVEVDEGMACKGSDCELCPGGDCGPCVGEYCENLVCPIGGSDGDVDVVFECGQVTVVSCKDLSNIVVELADGTRQRFEGLSGHRAVLDGVSIVRVWVKAGANHSGEGPGYGERFDAPESCEASDGGLAADAGKPGTALDSGMIVLTDAGDEMVSPR